MSDSAALNLLLAAARDAAARGTDYYALLDLDPSSGDVLTREVVQRAWRKRSLRYHPDKAGAGFDKDKWEEFGLARDILASEEARAAYDGARSAVLQRQRERELMSARQRRFAEELERAEAGGGPAAEEERGRRAAEQEAERGRQAAQGRAHMEERRRKLAEAEEKARERERREDDAREDRIRELEERIAEKARRKVEKRARRKERSSSAAGVAQDGGAEMLAGQLPAVAVPVSQLRRPAEHKTAPVPAVDVQMSDDPVGFWETRWPKTKARLLAAQRTKEGRVQETQAAA